jgi:hypothetical protein
MTFQYTHAVFEVIFINLIEIVIAPDISSQAKEKVQFQIMSSDSPLRSV